MKKRKQALLKKKDQESKEMQISNASISPTQDEAGKKVSEKKKADKSPLKDEKNNSSLLGSC